jgi:hypothetical protein
MKGCGTLEFQGSAKVAQGGALGHCCIAPSPCATTTLVGVRGVVPQADYLSGWRGTLGGAPGWRTGVAHRGGAYEE